MCVCVERGVRGPIYSSRGRFPPNACMEGDQVPWPRLLLEMHLDGRLARFGRPTGAAGPTWSPLILIFRGESDMWAHVKISWCFFLGSPVFSDMWTLLVSDTF